VTNPSRIPNTIAQLLSEDRGVVVSCRDGIDAIQTFAFIQKNYAIEVIPSLRGFVRRLRRMLRIASAEDKA